MAIKELHEIAARVMIEGMVDLGWIEDKDPEELLKDKAHQPFFMHGIGHHLGLDTHDSGPAESGGEPFPMQPGAVVTIEPGIYVSDGAEGVDPEYHGVGIRVEDDVLITHDGPDVLTGDVVKKPDDIETLMSEATPT